MLLYNFNQVGGESVICIRDLEIHLKCHCDKEEVAIYTQPLL